MSTLFHFVVFRVQTMENCASVNVGETVINLPLNFAKTNQGYGDNIGDGLVIPSSGFTFDPDLIDAPVWAARTDVVGQKGDGPCLPPPFTY